MATYPTFTDAPSRSSKERWLDDLQVDRATNGTPKVRALYTTPKRAFTVVHEFVSAAEKATLDETRHHDWSFLLKFLPIATRHHNYALTPMPAEPSSPKK